MRYLHLPIVLLLFPIANFAQSINVQPFLQDASPTSITIRWETTDSTETTVEWGLTQSLGNTATGTSFINEGTARIHDVELTGLSRFTEYYYRVKIDTVFTDIAQFKTPPFSSDKESFMMVAMSDMQRDGANPNKFSEIVEDGILDYVSNNFSDNISKELAFVMIPGDLVVTGWNYDQWADHFFTPSQNLFNQVPVYPVPGNHESNSDYFFNYFKLPNNGTPNFEEHWWYKDYSNTRIIGLDSNSPYTSTEQLNWLDLVLAEACLSDSIDFVFAQLHHPHKSELWTPGESNYTGEVISRLENFTTDCGKPSIHFFGHTHGYSRGQSRDHRHLWVNVATAGGAIDNWGEFPNADYLEFTRSQDDWGFVTVEVEAAGSPSFTLKRVSRGNEATFRDNEIRDSIKIYLNGEAPVTPIPLFPIDEVVNPECVILEANDFVSGSNSESHGASQWQVSVDCSDFSDPVIDEWRNYENWYYEIDTQAGDDLQDEKVTNMEPNTSYCWRVRYRDRQLNWSEWSTPTSFSTGPSTNSPNLLINPGAEADLSGWTPTIGVSEALTAGECDGIDPHTGDKYFAVGGVCTDGPYAECEQLVNLTIYADSIDAGVLEINWGGYLSNWGGQDEPAMKLYFMDESSTVIDSTETVSSLIAAWTLYDQWNAIPVGTRIISLTLIGTRNAGADNDSYFDDLFLRVGSSQSDCSELIVTSTSSVQLTKMEVVPNPFSEQTSIRLSHSNNSNLGITIQNVLGQQVQCPVRFDQDRIVVRRGNLGSGIYFFQVFSTDKLMGTGQFVVK